MRRKSIFTETLRFKISVKHGKILDCGVQGFVVHTGLHHCLLVVFTVS